MSKLKTLNAAALLYGDDPDLFGDAAEQFHESSKLYPTFVARLLPGMLVIESSPNVAATVTRAGKRYRHAPFIALPAAVFPDESLGSVLQRRRSAQTFASKPISLEVAATLFHAAVGITKRVTLENGEVQTYRTAPSGGALYPLEIYAVVNFVDGIEPGIYHYEPLEHKLESIRDASVLPEMLNAFAYAEAASTASMTLLISAMFWRSRFKYGLRSYRFTLLEAGHVAQNILLAAEALGLAAVPLGGFYDSRVDALLDLDGVNEGTIYTVAVGVPCGNS